MTNTNNIVKILNLDNSQDEIEWGIGYHDRFHDRGLTNARLFNILRKVGYKAVAGIVVALTEIIQKKLTGLFPNVDVEQEFFLRINALWAAAIDPLYLKTFKFDWKYFDENGVLSPYATNWFILRLLMGKYVESSYYVYDYPVNLSLLTRHLMPNKKVFDNWFAETLRKTAEVFPCSYDPTDLDSSYNDADYDCSTDAPVPREFFFDPKFEYSEEAAKHTLNAFLKSLDYNNNPWLCTPEEMLAKGFKGTPYEV